MRRGLRSHWCAFSSRHLQFPDGEQQFINAVRLYRDRIDDPKLVEEIRGFIGQEALHSREHKSYNEALKARGYDIEGVACDVYRHCIGNERLRRIVFLFVTWKTWHRVSNK